jgi:hypothetical protein
LGDHVAVGLQLLGRADSGGVGTHVGGTGGVRIICAVAAAIARPDYPVNPRPRSRKIGTPPDRRALSGPDVVVTDRGKEISDAAVTGATAANPRPPVRFAVCIDNGEYRFSLELHKIYRLVPDDAAAKVGQVRVIDESGSECLYPAAWFTELRIPRSVRDSIISGG